MVDVAFPSCMRELEQLEEEKASMGKKRKDWRADVLHCLLPS